jgi:hypothetical protein
MAKTSETMTRDASQLASRALAAEVKKKVRERCLVIWLDADGSYTEHVDALATGALDFPYPVIPLRGSCLELMLALEPYGNGLRPEHVLVHLPGLNKDTVKETPVYELCAAGIVFEKNLGTLVRETSVGIARPEEVEAFARAPGLSLAKADAWLEELSGQPRDRLSLLMESLGIDDVVLALLAGDRRFSAHLPEGGGALLAFLEKGLGLDVAWRRFRLGDAELRLDAITALVASWLMAVEFVHDLKEPPATPALRPLAALGPFAKESRRLAARFREQLPDAYEELANDLQTFLVDDRTGHHAGALGTIDTFRFEEATFRAATMDALRRGDWDAATQFAKERTPEQCFWVKRSQPLQRTWEMLRLAAVASGAFAANGKGLERCASLEEATQRYADKLAPVDRAHRLFEQRAHALVAPDLDDYDALLDVRASVRRAYRTWSDGVNRAFFELCVARGPLPDRAVRQRFIYDDVVHPMIEQGARVAFFMVDALRFEMAQGLAEDLKRDKYRVNLGARLAELPTVTAVGMNALAPVTAQNGHLRVVMKKGVGIAGFAGREFAVCEPTARVRAMSDRSLRSGSAADLTLDEFQDMSLAQLKRRLPGSPLLVVVRSRELDDAGENNLHLGTFDQSLTLVKTAISLLSQAGIERFVIASDHGFLLQDPTVENVPFGASKRVPERRHALLDSPSGMPDVLEVRLSALDYDVDDDRYLVFAPDTALWKKQDGIAPFVHGGNSLQERVIPVLQLERGVARGKTTSKYEVVARAEPAHLGRQRLRIAVRLQNRETATLGFLAPKTVSLALRTPGRPEMAITLLDAQPPAILADGRVLVPPNRDEVLVEFELAGQVDERVRIEVFHPEAIEDVTPKVVEGFFDVARSRGRSKRSEPPAAPGTSIPPVPPQPNPAGQGWAEQVTDDGFRRVLEILAERRVINEAELQQVLGSPMRVRAFARSYDKLVLLLPFEVEVLTVNGMKAYARKD